MSKIEEIESTTITKEGKEISIQTPKYNLITSHTARRSFCTNAFLSGMPAIDIMAISGHTTEKSFLIYIKATAEQKAQKIAEYDFFKQAPKMKVS
jgi:integrase